MLTIRERLRPKLEARIKQYGLPAVSKSSGIRFETLYRIHTDTREGHIHTWEMIEAYLRRAR